VEPESISATKIGGFRVIRRLASGATTDVLLAHADGTDRIVALKVLLQQFRSDPAFEQTFVREAAAYGRLSHPAIVELYDFFSVDGQFVMVLEYVDGLPLHKLRAMLSIGGEKVEDGAAMRRAIPRPVILHLSFIATSTHRTYSSRGMPM
jgi:serine/threonine-protein kinase